MAEAVGYCAVEPLKLFITQWMINGREKVFYSHDPIDVLEDP